MKGAQAHGGRATRCSPEPRALGHAPWATRPGPRAAALSHAPWATRLAQAVYLHAFTSGSVRDSLLACSIRHLLTRLDPATPTDVFVFVREERYDSLRHHLLQSLGPGNASRVCLLSISAQQWHYRPRKSDYRLPAWGTWHSDYLSESPRAQCLAPYGASFMQHAGWWR